eukprot:bmy_01033T0
MGEAERGGGDIPQGAGAGTGPGGSGALRGGRFGSASPHNPTPGREDQQIFAFLQPCLALPPDLADRPGAGWSCPHRPAYQPEARRIQVKRARMALPQSEE